MTTQYQRLLNHVSNLTRMVTDTMKVGRIHEVKGDKMRINLGKNFDGEPVLSPWLHSSNHRGGAREQRYYKGDQSKGQTVLLLAPGGDMRQAAVFPYAPNKDFLRPDHAKKENQDEETYQIEDLRVRKKKDTYTIWFQPPRQQQQQQGQQGQQGGGGQGETSDGGGMQQMPDEDSDADGNSAAMVLKISKDKGFVARVGKEMRMTVTKDLVKMKAKNDFAIVKDGQLIVSREWQVGTDPSQDDDEL